VLPEGLRRRPLRRRVRRLAVLLGRRRRAARPYTVDDLETVKELT
jgi:hypothetical protein